MKHKKYLNMITWDVLTDPSSTPVCVISCPLNPGVLDDQGNMIVQPAQIYVDDAILAAIKRPAMGAVLASIIKAISVTMGKPNEQIRQCPLDIDKWHDLVVGEHQILLGLRLNA